jgi:transposase InsO family protein
MTHIHPQARTTPLVRAEIRASSESLATLAQRYNLSLSTVRKWKRREDVQDRSHRPHRLSSTLTPAQEVLVIELRKLLLLSLDDLLVVTREFIHPGVSRSGLDRCLRRYGVSNLRALQPEVDGEKEPKKTYKDYAPGFVHIDIKYLPKMQDEAQRRYLFVAIDRATRFVFMHIYDDQSELSSTDFLRKVVDAAPMKIIKLLTDNGSQFTDRFTRSQTAPAGEQTPSGRHAFDRVCTELGIEHRLSPPRHPQTNGMVERFNGRISEVIEQTRFHSAAELERTLQDYLQVYNHHIPQRALNHQTPFQALQKWYKDKPELFVKNVYDQPGLDKCHWVTWRVTWGMIQTKRA